MEEWLAVAMAGLLVVSGCIGTSGSGDESLEGANASEGDPGTEQPSRAFEELYTFEGGRGRDERPRSDRT
jgi:hypothetical protein